MIEGLTERIGLAITTVAAVTTLAAVLASPVASADAADPQYKLWAVGPDSITDGKPVQIHAWIENTGVLPLTGTLTVTNTFPAGIVPATPNVYGANLASEGREFTCQIVNQESICEIDVDGLPPGSQVRVTYGDRFGGTPFPIVQGATGTVVDTVTATGGGTASAQTVQQPMTVGATEPFAVRTFTMEMPGGDGAPDTQAGSTPTELANTLQFKMVATDPFGIGIQSYNAPAEHLRNVVVHAPAGFIGDPVATSQRCTLGQLDSASPYSPGQRTPACPQNSQIGVAHIYNPSGPEMMPVFNLVPPAGSPAAIGFNYLALTTVLTARLRPNDNGIDIISKTTPTTIPVPAVYVTLWGAPADSSHDYLRDLCMDESVWMGNAHGEKCPSDAEDGTLLPPKPYLRMPTSCSDGPLPWSVEADSYEHPDVWVSGSTTTPATTNCSAAPFDPGLTIAPSTSPAHSPTGLDATVTLPQEPSAKGLWEADLKAAAVTLPEGMTINPSSASGLGACADAQLRLGLEGPAQCPDSSKIGSLELKTPLLDHPLSGSVFLRSQGSGAPESGDLYRIALEIRSDEDGVDIKLPGAIKADPKSGRLTTVFDNLPQLPFESMQLHLKDGPRAPLVNPPSCGPHNGSVELTGWNGKVVDQTVKFATSGDCDSGFAPGLSAGTEDRLAGATSPFHLRITRGDSDQELSGLQVTLPPGLSGYLKGIPYCPDAALGAVSAAPGTGAAQEASPSCPAASRVGTVTVGAGAGTNPFYTQAGRAYLAGPYKGAPLSLAVIAPAVAGPFDLGSVVVRNAIHIDPTTAQLTVVSDPLPTILQGIPLDLRDVRVDIDREHFTLNPTSCEPMAVGATITSVAGLSATRSKHFQAVACERLAFRPSLSVALAGKTRRAGHPALTATLVMPQKGANANIGRASVALPRSEFLAQGHIRTVCTRVQYAAGAGGGAQCPKGSVYGHATAWSPLLDRPLSGPVYLRSSNNPLPDLVASLEGQIHIDLSGRIDSKNGGIRTTFAQVPDAPVSKFVLRMPGGVKSLLENSTNICRGSHRATARFVGQNGKLSASRPKLAVRCGGARGKH